MSALTFGDTFTLPATGQREWRIHDIRPVSPPWLSHQAPDRATASAACGPNAAHYTPTKGWRVYAPDSERPLIEADLSALTVNLGPRTEDEWRDLHFHQLREATEQVISAVIGYPRGLSHPFVTDEESIAYIAATAAAAVAKARGPELFAEVHATVLEHLSA